MAKSPRIVALVPMGDHSERVPGKNYRELAGWPLFHHILAALGACPEISAIVVDTDSEAVKEGIEQHFPTITLLDRPQHLRGGHIPMNEILLYDTSQVDADYYVQTHSTNPLLLPATISRAIQAFQDGLPQHDSLFSVTALHTRLYDSQGRAINHDPDELLRTQDLPRVYEENSCIYIFSRATLAQRGHRIGAKPVLFPIPSEEAIDIDDELDFQIAEFLMGKRD